MIASALSDFTEMVNMGMRLEEGVREGRLSRDDGSSAKKCGGFSRKKEGETHDVSSHVKRRPSMRRKDVRPAVNQHQAYQPHNNNITNTSNYERKRVTFDPIPMTYAELYPSLIDRKFITPRDPPATKVQDLVRSGILFFEDVGPNVKKNLLPENGKASINMVQGCPGKYKVLYVNDIRHSLVEMHKLLCEHRHYEHDHDRFQVCTINERGCRQVRKDIQEMLDQGMIEILQNRNEDEVDVITLVFKILDPVVIKYDGSKKKVSPTLVQASGSSLVCIRQSDPVPI
ncbi:hypothetical protein KIW84_031035 [Lathyrus oleraceus]|uniref:Uncharacterized protein n=1 Tax=Pisum sativum TaxID=3888 RepID=A0A9D4XTY4_PEA|nr:hypothetical protein KIW84_031035 [Pisum sativum]